jgi:diguanylate cyclase (GGDEF)-like protein
MIKVPLGRADVPNVDGFREVVDEIQLQLDEERWLRNAMFKVPRLVREGNPARQREIVAADIAELMDAETVRIYEVAESGKLELAAGQDSFSIPADAQQMERELLARAVPAGKSLLSSHPHLDGELAELAARCAAQGLVTEVMPISIDGGTHGAFGAHWLTKQRPGETRRITFYSYFWLAKSVLASTRELERLDRRLAELHHHAYVDQLTGLPSGLALDEQLRGHNDTVTLSVVSLDFDGMREANSAFGYEQGGDVLIRAVGHALGDMTQDPEFPARQHRGGDEFAVILPGADAGDAAQRAAQIERQLDELPVPRSHLHVYKGASVGHATRQPGEEPGQTLGRAIESMTERKRARRIARTEQPTAPAA